MTAPGPNGEAWLAYRLRGKAMAVETIRVSDVPIIKQLFSKALKDGQLEKLPIYLDASVLDSYKEKDDYKIIRTDTSGRISKTGGWSLDFGISHDDAILQVTAESFVHRIPDKEKEQWLAHLVSLPTSQNFIKGVIRPGCLDDGAIRSW